MPHRTDPDTITIDIRTEAFADFMADYPYAADVDTLDDLPLQSFTTGGDSPTPFEARVLGFGSSYRKTHLNHSPGTRPPGSCSGCRWTDTAILWAQPLEDEGDGLLRPVAPWMYVFVSLGKSVIPGEEQRATIIWTDDAEEVLRQLFAPVKPEFRRARDAKAIPPHNAAAFRDAAHVDAAIAALVDRYASAIPEVDRSGVDADPLAGL